MRLTVLFDPGRIKQGLKPREEVGPPLLPGRKYTLLIDSHWPDAAGEPLAGEYRKKFFVLPPDTVQPALQRWMLQAPVANSLDPLEVTFAESLDRAMLEHVLAVTDSEGNDLDGNIEIAAQETRWRFHPAARWKPGRYRLVVEKSLEDLAGNSIGRAFEVELTEDSTAKDAGGTDSLPFEVLAAPVEGS